MSLKSCPHCGQPDDGLETRDFTTHANVEFWEVACCQCGATVPGSTEAEACAAWNRRHTLHVRMVEQPEVIDDLLRALNRHALGAGLQYALPLSAAKDTDALRALVVAWVEKLEGDRNEKENEDTHATVQRFSPIAADHPEATCDDCGGANVVWFAPSEWWSAVVRRPPDIGHPGGDPMLCPRCFILRAEALGIRLVWQVAPEAGSAQDAVKRRRMAQEEMNRTGQSSVLVPALM